MQFKFGVYMVGINISPFVLMKEGVESKVSFSNLDQILKGLPSGLCWWPQVLGNQWEFYGVLLPGTKSNCRSEWYKDM